MVAIGVGGGGGGGGGGGWTRKHLFLIKWAIINEAFLYIGMNLWLHSRMELLIFMVPPSWPFIKRKNMFWP